MAAVYISMVNCLLLDKRKLSSSWRSAILSSVNRTHFSFSSTSSSSRKISVSLINLHSSSMMRSNDSSASFSSRSSICSNGGHSGGGVSGAAIADVATVLFIAVINTAEFYGPRDKYARRSKYLEKLRNSLSNISAETRAKVLPLGYCFEFDLYCLLIRTHRWPPRCHSHSRPPLPFDVVHSVCVVYPHSPE